MWWYFVKLNETENMFIYSYGFESKETTGQFEYDKKTNKINILNYAKNHFENTDIQLAAYQLVKDHSDLEHKIIAYG